MDLTLLDGQVHSVIGSKAAEGLDDPSELERRYCYPVYPVCSVPSASFFSASATMVLTAAGTWES